MRTLNGVAPIRICDIGGWTDTWFAGHGRVLNIGVYPYVEVQAAVHPRDAREDRVVLHAENYGDRYALTPGEPLPDRHPLLEAVVDEMGVPDDCAVELTVHAEVPPGASTGTSAAVTVALVGLLARLTGRSLTAHEVAMTAHRIEHERLGMQSGIQDQMCAAYGGVSLIEMHSFPHAAVSPLHLADTTRWELERRLVLLFLGRTHVSSEVHRAVIARLEREDGSRELDTMRALPLVARDALANGDFAAFGAVMDANTEAQATLHPALVSDAAHAVMDLARRNGAIGCKVNGAGGEGGSLTLLCGPDAAEKRRMLRALVEMDPRLTPIPLYLSRFGLRVWES